jgi:hypothetical protein
MTDSYTEFEAYVRQGGAAAIREAGAFFMGEDPVHRALHAIAERLGSLQIPYAIAGGMALVAHGFERTTTDVDVLVTPSGLLAVHEQLEGLGYVPPFPGSKQLRDINTKVRIEFLVTGQYPGDGKPKPVAFPDPTDVAVDIDGIRYLRLSTLIELKLASGITGGVLRLKDFADVVALIGVLKIPSSFAEQLSPYVQDKFCELWQGIADAPDPHAE